MWKKKKWCTCFNQSIRFKTTFSRDKTRWIGLSRNKTTNIWNFLEFVQDNFRPHKVLEMPPPELACHEVVVQQWCCGSTQIGYFYFFFFFLSYSSFILSLRIVWCAGSLFFRPRGHCCCYCMAKSPSCILCNAYFCVVVCDHRVSLGGIRTYTDWLCWV